MSTLNTTESTNSLDVSRASTQELCFKELDDMLEKCTQEKKMEWKPDIEGFKVLFTEFLKRKSIDWDKISPPPEESIKALDQLECVEDSSVIKQLLGEVIVIKLNGGLGTTMGCSYPKSLIQVRDNMSFLDITMKQMEALNLKYDTRVPLVLMNSYNTDEDTKKILSHYEKYVTPIYTFIQSKYPRIDHHSLRPTCKSLNDEDIHLWYPPGHGNIYEALNNSGLLDKFIENGRHFAFVSNADNLGASVDIQILNFLCKNKDTDMACDYIMEVTDKTRADIKGGTLILYENCLKLLEIAQVPKEHVESFKSVSKFKIFNTNNIWFNLKSVKNRLKEGNLSLDVIVNEKVITHGNSIIQLETAIGSAIHNFPNAIGINVPRSRFLPVKSNSDLFLVQSNLYTCVNGTMTMNPLRQFATTPLVQFSGNHFRNVQDYLSRFENIPDILELYHLTISGDVTFGKDVVLKGTVIIIAQHGERIDIPSGAILENKIVSGNLRILSH